MAPGIDPETILLGEVMSPEVVAVRDDAGVAESIDLMRLKSVCRLPVVDAGGALMSRRKKQAPIQIVFHGIAHSTAGNSHPRAPGHEGPTS